MNGGKWGITPPSNTLSPQSVVCCPILNSDRYRTYLSFTLALNFCCVFSFFLLILMTNANRSQLSVLRRQQRMCGLWSTGKDRTSLEGIAVLVDYDSIGIWSQKIWTLLENWLINSGHWANIISFKQNSAYGPWALTTALPCSVGQGIKALTQMILFSLRVSSAAVPRSVAWDFVEHWRGTYAHLHWQALKWGDICFCYCPSC